MRLSRRFVPVDLDEHKATRIVQLLNDIKSGDSHFPNARLCILNSGVAERLNEFRFYADMNVND